jgi:hypothetical protein
MALARAARKSSSAGRWASVGCTISEMRSIVYAATREQAMAAFAKSWWRE